MNTIMLLSDRSIAISIDEYNIYYITKIFLWHFTKAQSHNVAGTSYINHERQQGLELSHRTVIFERCDLRVHIFPRFSLELFV